MSSRLILVVLVYCIARVMALCTYKVGVLKWGLSTETEPHVLLSQIFERTDGKGYKVECLPIILPDNGGYQSVLLVQNYLKQQGINVVVAPYNGVLSNAATQLQIPYMAMTIVAPEHRGETNIMVDLLPSFDDLATLVNHMAHTQNWGEIAILYDGELGLPLIEKLVQDKSIRLNAWKLPKQANETTVRSVLLDIRQELVRTLVLLCECRLSEKILHQAVKYSMLSSTYNWFLPYLNPYCIDFTPIQFSGVNLTTLHIIDEMLFNNAIKKSQMFETATFTDAVQALNMVFGRLSKNGDCTLDQEVFKDELINVTFSGLTGQMQFDPEGQRVNYTVHMAALSSDGLYPYATWNASSNHHSERELSGKLHDAEITDDFPFGKKVLRVVTMLEPPFVMRRTDISASLVTANELYEGYCIDILVELARRHGFRYELYLSPDGKWGSELDNGTWNGLMGELLYQKADMSISSLTITAEREDLIDFSKPFKNRGISILMKKQEETTSYFQFLEPLSHQVWVMVFLALFVVSIVLYALDRLIDTEKRFDIMESVWFSYGALVQGGTEVIPKTLSTRILTSVWWFFSLILISSYTANLAAFLTVSKFNTPIKDVNDLVGQSKVEYGTVPSTTVYWFFERSKIESFRKMGNYMKMINPSAMAENTLHGIERVKNSSGDYAFIWDDPVVKYQTTLDCDLIEVGRPFDSKGYGIAVPRGAPYRDVLSMSILKMNEEGILNYLDKKWWAHSKCPADPTRATAENQELTVEMVAGVFFLLAGGIIFSILVCLIQLLARRSRPKPTKRSAEVCDATPMQPLWNSTAANNLKAAV